jgi:NADPH:quinone reductase-like Zn-dependent oxidoreductase
MKALISRRGSLEPELADVDRQDLHEDEIRVTVAAAAFTYFDGFVAAHHDSLGLPEQVGLGFDFSGTIIEVGAKVDGFAVGDRVAGLTDDITAPVRAHAEELVVSASAAAIVPDALDLPTAAAVPLSALTARQALDLLGPEGGTLLITGAAGAVGGWLVELATREGWSVTALVRPGTEAAVTAATVITELTGSFDAVLDTAALHGPALSVVRDGGRYVGFKPSQQQTPERGVAVQTVLVRPDGASLAGLLALASAGNVQVRVAGMARLADAQDAYASADMQSGSRGRWLLVP